MAQNPDDKILLDLYKKMEEISICMLTTKANDGSLHSRPMAVQRVDLSGQIWFFTCDRTLKMHEIDSYPEVNLSFNDKEDTFISVSGRGSLVKDKEKMQTLWNDSLKAWFPDGLAEPGLALLEVDAEDIAYWISEENKLKLAFHFAKAFVTGEQAETGESGNVHLES